MFGRRSPVFGLLALVVVPEIFAQTQPVPQFVVPAFADLTIKTRHTFGSATSGATDVLYLKGARERHEFVREHQEGIRGFATITQCDQRRVIQVNLKSQLYAVSELEDRAANFAARRPLPEEHGADVTTTFDAVDTGERRQVGRYTARRVRTTITVEPAAGANTPASTRQIDGWYIDLPSLGCSDAESTGYVVYAEMVEPVGLPDRHHYKVRGTARRGYAIEETTRFTQRTVTNVGRVELIELSEEPLDASLFDVPRDYRPALPLVGGGFDISKPDTVVNRLADYWSRFRRIAGVFFY